jgi:hypothetical protein
VANFYAHNFLGAQRSHRHNQTALLPTMSALGKPPTQPSNVQNIYLQGSVRIYEKKKKVKKKKKAIHFLELMESS